MATRSEPFSHNGIPLLVVSTIILLRQCIISFMSETINTSNRQIARAAGTVMVAFALSQLIGLVRGILVAKTFGLGPEMDAFGAANVVPNLLFSLVAGGALASAFVPIFTTKLASNDRPGAWRLVSSVNQPVVDYFDNCQPSGSSLCTSNRAFDMAKISAKPGSALTEDITDHFGGLWRQWDRIGDS